MRKITKLKTDKYRSVRGGHSRLLNLHCRKCGHILAVYQKDGPGNLRRMYMDRIFAPEKLVGLQHMALSKINQLTCDACGFVMGVPIMYKKEKRKAFRLFQDAVVKRRRKLDN